MSLNRARIWGFRAAMRSPLSGRGDFRSRGLARFGAAAGFFQRFRRRLVCRFRGHDDAVTGVHAGIGAALLECDRCQRRKAVPYRGALVPDVTEQSACAEAVTVDRGALQLLQVGAAVDASYSGLLRLLLNGEDT